MSQDVSGNPELFDLERLRELVELMEQHGLTEISLCRGDEKWHLRRGPQEVVQMVPAGAYPAPVAQTQPPVEEQSPDTKEKPGLLIKSPTVGTFFAASGPDDPPFVTIGAKIEPETIVCIVEAMKVFNQIPAEVGGTIAEILVNNGDPVEFGQPLFRVQPG